MVRPTLLVVKAELPGLVAVSLGLLAQVGLHQRPPALFYYRQELPPTLPLERHLPLEQSPYRLALQAPRRQALGGLVEHLASSEPTVALRLGTREMAVPAVPLSSPLGQAELARTALEQESTEALAVILLLLLGLAEPLLALELLTAAWVALLLWCRAMAAMPA